MNVDTHEFAKITERVDTIETILRALGVPLGQLGPMLAEDHVRLTPLSEALTTAFRYAGVPVPESLRPRSRSHLHVVQDGER